MSKLHQLAEGFASSQPGSDSVLLQFWNSNKTSRNNKYNSRSLLATTTRTTSFEEQETLQTGSDSESKPGPDPHAIYRIPGRVAYNLANGATLGLLGAGVHLTKKAGGAAVALANPNNHVKPIIGGVKELALAQAQMAWLGAKSAKKVWKLTKDGWVELMDHLQKDFDEVKNNINEELWPFGLTLDKVIKDQQNEIWFTLWMTKGRWLVAEVIDRVLARKGGLFSLGGSLGLGGENIRETSYLDQSKLKRLITMKKFYFDEQLKTKRILQDENGIQGDVNHFNDRGWGNLEAPSLSNYDPVSRVMKTPIDTLQEFWFKWQHSGADRQKWEYFVMKAGLQDLERVKDLWQLYGQKWAEINHKIQKLAHLDKQLDFIGQLRGFCRKVPRDIGDVVDPLTGQQAGSGKRDFGFNSSKPGGSQTFCDAVERFYGREEVGDMAKVVVQNLNEDMGLGLKVGVEQGGGYGAGRSADVAQMAGFRML